jgi:glycosyltransferase 2 family protein
MYAGSVLNRLRANRWLRAALLYGIIAFCCYGVVTEWPQVHASLNQMHWYSVAGAALAALAGWLCMVMVWSEVIADLGSPLPLSAAVRVMSVVQLAKYLPGGVWAFAAQIELGSEYRVPRRRSATAAGVSLALTFALALAIAAVVLPLVSTAAALQYWWALAIAPVIGVCLAPPVLGRLVDRVLILARRQPLERRPSMGGIARALGWAALGWLLWGLQVWLLVRDLTGLGTRALPVAIGGYALAWAAGTMIVVTPGGLGARELALIAVLAPIMPRGEAIAVALVSRATMTFADLAWGGVGRAARRWAPGAAPVVEPVAAEPGQEPGPGLPLPALVLGESLVRVRPGPGSGGGEPIARSDRQQAPY